MASFLLAGAVFILAMVALGLFRIFCGPADVDRMMAVQLLGTGGVAVLLLLAVALEIPAVLDVALMLALLAAFTAVTFVTSASGSPVPTEDATDPR